MKWLLLFFMLVPPLYSISTPLAQAEGVGWLVAARRTAGQSDLWAAPISDVGAWRPLTGTPDDERWPAWDPNFERLAYAARRDNNWDLYTLDLRSGREERLTTDPHFDGWPAWSPDGKYLAFASAREGELDLFLLDLETGEEENITFDSPAHDFQPVWEDDRHLLFVSTRDGSQDIFRLNIGTRTVTALLSTAERDEKLPLLVPGDDRGSQGRLLVVARGERSTDLIWLSEQERGGPPLSWGGTVTSAIAVPSSQEVIWLERRQTGMVLYRRALEGGTAERLAGPFPALGDLTFGMPDDIRMQTRLLAPPTVALPPAQAVPGELVEVSDLDTELPVLSSRVLPAFQTLRTQVAAELGSDFLGEVSETLRPIDFDSEESDYLSWHKAGRAIDTILDLGWQDRHQMLEIVREDEHGDVYWRVWLRCPIQDGSCGEPLTEAPWDWSHEARWEIAPGEGGIRKSFQAGYYLDFTRLAEDGGWMRIPSYEVPGFDWRENKVALEYWHYQYTEGLQWFDAMREVYTPEELEEWMSWEALQDKNLQRWQLRAKGVPLPPALESAPVEMVFP